MATLLASSALVLPSSIKHPIHSQPSFSSLHPHPLFSSLPTKFTTRVSFFSGFLNRTRDVQSLKDEIFDTIAPLDRGAEATPEDQQRVDMVKYVHVSKNIWTFAFVLFCFLTF